jgi:putative iron-dependent peroxidase
VSTPQTGIFDRSYQHHLFFEFCLSSGQDIQAVKAALGQLNALKSEKTPVLMAFGPALWEQLDSRFTFPPFSLEGHVPARVIQINQNLHPNHLLLEVSCFFTVIF